MRKVLLLSALSFLISHSVKAQSAADAAVQLSALVQASPPKITLNWPGNASTTQYQVFRKLKDSTSWGNALAVLNGTTNLYVDNTVSIDTSYEYLVRRFGSGYSGYGYINSGIKVREKAFRGKLILLVDSTFITSLSAEIKRLIDDIEGDGWQVIRHDVKRTGSVTHVKDLIVTDYYTDTIPPKAVFLLGHVPVPYSGNINPDGHGDHLGAWPADCYYGDVDGSWTDIFVNSTTASPPRTQNIPGDGKFDQSILPSDMELQVGRVDFNDMPAFTASEQQLLKNYLDKDHDYRKKIFSPLNQAVIDDNFGFFSSEAFAASGFKNFGPLVGNTNISSADYFTSMTSASYKWSYGCGGGTYNSAGGIGTTANFAAANLQGVFTMLFGSYFGDWDTQNNFLKAPLAQGKVLTSVWSGRPHYQFHHMAMGENIVYDIMLTQNNPGGLYYGSPTSISGRWIHNALMGDPTLRNDVVAPVSNVIATKNGYNCNISWSASTETTLIGYNIYMKNDTNTAFIKINASPVTATTFTDYCLPYKGIYTYMVRTLKLEQSPSGTYYNLSEGISDTAYNSSNIKTLSAFNAAISANQVNLSNTSINANSYKWTFGNGTTSTLLNPTVTYTSNGSYTIMLVASNACYNDTSYQFVTINEVGIKESTLLSVLNLFPNPSQGSNVIKSDRVQTADISIYNNEGRKVFVKNDYQLNEELDLHSLAKGLYFVQIKTGDLILNKKLVLE